MKKISIVTISYNIEGEIQRTLDSILNLQIDDFALELIILDGASKDGTVQIIENNVHRFEEKGIAIDFRTEQDNGIYDAMNKGVKKATGEWILFMNGGDEFYSDNSLFLCAKKLDVEYDIVYGNSLIFFNADKCVEWLPETEDQITYKKGSEFNHQAAFIKSDYMKKNLYTLDYQIAGDTDFFVKSFVNGASFKHIDVFVSKFYLGGISGNYKTKLEDIDIRHKYHITNSIEHIKELAKAYVRLGVRILIPAKMLDCYVQAKILKQANDPTNTRYKIHE